jgi:hypothetical protein
MMCKSMSTFLPELFHPRWIEVEEDSLCLADKGFAIIFPFHVASNLQKNQYMYFIETFFEKMTFCGPVDKS